MKVLLVNSMVPFQPSESDEYAVTLQKHIVAIGHTAEILRIPVSTTPADVPSQCLMIRAFELAGVDRVIALSFPASLIRHPQKTVWQLEQPIWPDLDQDLHNVASQAQKESLIESKHLFTATEALQQQWNQTYGLSTHVLSPITMTWPVIVKALLP